MLHLVAIEQGGVLRVTNLQKTFSSDFGRVSAIDGVSFTVENGEFFTLVGPSGCGKTTTLQCIGGMETPDAGEIVMDGLEVFPGPGGRVVPAHRRDIGMVFQSYAIWPHMTVFDNVAFPLVHGRRKLPGREVRDRVMWALGLVQLEHLAERPAPFLSGGQQQRVALARAVVHEPKLLLLDEPLSNLDARLRAEMRGEIRNLVERLHITTLYVTHDQVEALSMSDRVAVMSTGRIVQQGTPSDVYFTPRTQFVAEFLGIHTLLEGTVASTPDPSSTSSYGAVETTLGRLSCRMSPPLDVGDPVRLAIHSAGLQVARNGSARLENTVTGTLESVQFTGEVSEGVLRVGESAVRVTLDPFQKDAAGDRLAIHVPPERCVAIPLS